VYPESYQDYINWLYGLQRFGIKLGLEKISFLLEDIENPHRQYPVIHIAGTNGKGSIASMIASVLQTQGLKTGLYTSPHLVRFTERIKINGEEIPEKEVVRYSERIQPRVDSLKATFFEATTAIAMQYFADNDVDVAILETGLGGRFDATNVVIPVLSIITSVGLEHQKYLGRTLTRIAYEKGGIIKESIPVVSGVQSARAAEVLRQVATYKQAPFIEVNPHATAVLVENNLHKSVVDMFFPEPFQYEGITIGLPGLYQIQNALIAVRALDVLRGRIKNTEKIWNITDEHIRRGLENVTGLTGIRGRMQLIQKNKGRWILDVAHNPGAMRELVRSLTELGYTNVPIMLGILDDKDAKSMIRILSKIARVMYFVHPNNERALKTEELREMAEGIFFPVTAAGSVAHGIQTVTSKITKDELILITGSHFVVGEALEILE
jgi:dihydrofolate synthase / folylpolyglutamate synthase